VAINKTHKEKEAQTKMKDFTERVLELVMEDRELHGPCSSTECTGRRKRNKE
jgi:hypothetical protein